MAVRRVGDARFLRYAQGIGWLITMGVRPVEYSEMAMTRERFWVALLFFTGVLPATAIAVIFTFVGFLPFILGIYGAIAGNVDFAAMAQNKKSVEMALLWVSAPLGWIGLVTLWKLSNLSYRKLQVTNKRNAILGLFAGTVAGAHLLYIGVGLLLLLLPSLAYFALKLYRENGAVQSDDPGS